MMYLYHLAPQDMAGTTLYPLNALKDTLPEVFKSQNKKYEGREFVKETKIPGLGAWNDVIHLSPIDPAETRQALREAGSPVSSSWKVFRINANILDESRLLIYARPEGVTSEEDIFMPFTEENYARHHHLPDETRAYYRQCIKEGRQILLYVYAPHVLYGGAIDITKADIVEYIN